ncbi:ovarian cancer G-protein coupled receptor 1-like [Sparus aurata]|uniref:ovarian cancer G-protein coupled receptor 1-like n=1 Tax=Sparus aurata TaxID=8175 RepID=UPI0011C0CF77|nr:ovarian cancer G-protein coupled receptor 1-like [Sparus aurata]
MEDFYRNTSLNESFNNSNVTSSYSEVFFIRDVLAYIIVSIGLPLILVVIYALYLLVRNDHVAPIYVINLLITDLIQLCYMIVWLTRDKNLLVTVIFIGIYDHCIGASVCFMVCVAMERYLVIAHPLWYRFRRTIKSSVVICVVVWVLPVVIVLFLWFQYPIPFLFPSVIPYFLLLPFPLLIFFLFGTVRALCTSISVPSDEKRRIVGTLVLVLLIYTLLFLPIIISVLIVGSDSILSRALLPVLLSPLADLLLYVFIKKGTIDKFLVSVCCCRKDSNDIRRAGSNDISTVDNNDTCRMDSNETISPSV